MGVKDEKTRAAQVREKARLRATLADEPSSGYAYHDEVRVESLRGPRGTSQRPANDAGPARPGAAKRTMVGGFEAPHAERADVLGKKRPLSEPPDVGSWPPMPSVPPELAGAAEGSESERDDDDPEHLLEVQPTNPPKMAAPKGAAIWEAMPSVVSSSAPDEADSEPEQEQELPQATQAAAIPEHTPSGARLHNPELAERMSTISAAYADTRLARLEQLIERSAWDQLHQELKSEKDLTPVLQLVHVIARRELLPSDDKGSSVLTREAIRAVASLLQVPEDSPTALLLTKRLLRRNPGWAHTQKAGTKLSVSLTIAGLLLGTGIGWLITHLLL